MRIVCDNPHHDAGEGVCVFCVQNRIKDAVKAERERCAKIVETYLGRYEGGIDGKGALMMVAENVARQIRN